LSYDFYPLQGIPPPTAPQTPAAAGHISFAPTPPKNQRASRISALEIAVRAQVGTLVFEIFIVKDFGQLTILIG
jgi:hypothetical protein